MLRLCSFTLLFLICGSLLPVVALPIVSNVRAVQRAGGNMVDIFYDLTFEAGRAHVVVHLSDDDGETYTLVPSTLSGHVGARVSSGVNRHIVWDAGRDLPDTYAENMRARVTVAPESLPPLSFVLIPRGNFQMGDSLNEGNIRMEQPVHTVWLETYIMSRTLITKAQWDAVRTWAIISGRGYTDLPVGGGKGADHPVYGVSWFEAVQWLNALSEMEGLTPVYTVGGEVLRSGQPLRVDIAYAADGYRLPTEAEWEKAARGGLAGRRFPWGNTISHSQGNYNSAIDRTSQSYDVSPTTGHHPDWVKGGTPYTSPVETFAPNAYGLHDMVGNLWQWCNDWYQVDYYKESPSTAPKGPDDYVQYFLRVVRGGSWDVSAFACRVAMRNSRNPFRETSTEQIGDIGFRAVRTAGSP